MIGAQTTGLGLIGAAWADAWRPRPRQSLADWAGQHFYVTDDAGHRREPFNYADYPYARGLMDLVDDPEVETVVWLKASQVGGTTTTLALMAALSQVSPAPMMWAGPNRDYVREKRELFYACCERSPALADRIPPRNLRNDRMIHLHSCVAYLAWSGSSQTLSGRACRTVLCSEVDRWEDSPKVGRSALLVKERVKSFPYSFTIFYESTPSDEASTVEALYQESDQRRWLVPCPQCGHWQQLRFFVHRGGPHAGCGGLGGLEDSQGRPASPEEARRNGHYICERGCRISSSMKPAMLRRGVWVPLGQSVDSAGRLTGEPERPKRRAGCQNSSLDAVRISFGRAAEEVALARRDGTMRELWNNWLGRAYTPRRKAPRWHALGKRLAGTYLRGIVPAEAYFLTAGSDVQANRCYWIVRAWGVGQTNWLVDWGVVRREGELDMEEEADAETAPIDSDLAQLPELVLDRRWPVAAENAWGQSQLGVALANIDCNYRTLAVQRFARKRRDVVRCVAGDHYVTPGDLYRMTIVEKNARTGKPYPGGLERWGIDTGTYKEDIIGRWVDDPDEPGRAWLPAGIVEAGADYLKQVTNEEMRVEVMPSGKRVRRWTVLDEAIGNHYFDCEVYAAAAADMVVGQDWSVENLNRLGRQAAGVILLPTSDPAVDTRIGDGDEGFSAR